VLQAELDGVGRTAATRALNVGSREEIATSRDRQIHGEQNQKPRRSLAGHGGLAQTDQDGRLGQFRDDIRPLIAYRPQNRGVDPQRAENDTRKGAFEYSTDMSSRTVAASNAALLRMVHVTCGSRSPHKEAPACRVSLKQRGSKLKRSEAVSELGSNACPRSHHSISAAIAPVTADRVLTG